MSNASTADARAGWEFFRLHRDATLDQVNEMLKRAGHRPIHDRTYQHYRHLDRAGYDRYVSINRFDVARASRPFEGASTSSRYTYYDIDVPVSVSFLKNGDEFVARGTAEKVGEVGAIITFDERESVQAIRQAHLSANTYVQLTVQVPPSRSIMARTVDIEADERTALVEIEFTRLHSIRDLAPATSLPMERIEFRVHGSSTGRNTVDLVARRLYYFLEATEIARAIANDVASFASPSSEVHRFDPPELVGLRTENPLVLDLAIGVPITGVLITGWCLARSGLTTVSQFMERLSMVKVNKAIARKIAAEAESITIDNSFKKEDLAIIQLIYGVARSGIELRTTSATTVPNDKDNAPGSRKIGLAHQLIDSIRNLERQDVAEIEAHPPPEAA